MLAEKSLPRQRDTSVISFPFHQFQSLPGIGDAKGRTRRLARTDSGRT